METANPGHDDFTIQHRDRDFLEGRVFSLSTAPYADQGATMNSSRVPGGIYQRA